MKEKKAGPAEMTGVVRGKLISIAEASKMTSLGKNWFYDNMNNGTLPFPWYKLTTGKRFMDSWDVEGWLQLCKVPACSLPGEYEEAL